MDTDHLHNAAKSRATGDAMTMAFGPDPQQ